MAQLQPGFSVPSKQRAERPNARKASVSVQASKRTEFDKPFRGRPIGSGTRPEVARVEAFVEALIGLHSCADIETADGEMFVRIERAHEFLDAKFESGQINADTFDRCRLSLRRIALRASDELTAHGAHVERDIIPEAQRGYDSAEAACA